jgi:hypothetical protein
MMQAGPPATRLNAARISVRDAGLARAVLSHPCDWMPRMMTAIAARGADVAGLGAAYWRMWTAAVVSRFGDALRSPALSLLAAA